MSLKSFTSAKTKPIAKTLAATAPPPPPAYPSTALPRIGARVSKRSERRIKELALECDCTVQTLVVRGLSKLLEERGLAPLEELE